MAPRLASESLGRLGLQVRGQQLLIANCAEGLAQILRDTPWSSSWNTILSRLAGASRCEKPVHFPCMGTRRAVALPLAIVTV